MHASPNPEAIHDCCDQDTRFILIKQRHAVRELEAESVCHLVCTRLGIGSTACVLQLAPGND